ncbi:stalk domain-containing protein [Paenibacillus sp. GCM10027628]|uniref:stalk domain-containing protein n=1 Tax=Paenibacillus sp. GCM10027628 TaxID=3273413 RepID=UPI003625FBFB
MMKQRNLFQKKSAAWLKLSLAAAFVLALMPYNGVTAHAEDYSSDVKLNLAPLYVQIGDNNMQVPGGLSTEGDSYVGLAFLSKQLGLTTSWDETTRIVTVSSPGKTMKMTNQSTTYDLNGHHFYSSKPPVIVEGTTYLPLRFLLEQMGYSIGYTAADKLISIQPIKENALKLTNTSIGDSKTEDGITIQYPQIEGWEHTAASSKINAFLKAEALKFEASGKELLKEVKGDQTAGGPELRFSFDVNYTVTYNQQNKLSLHFDTYQYTGGAHGMYDMDAHTFDLLTGEEITLKQAALNDPNYKQIINNEIKKQIQEREYVLLTPFESIGDDQRFYLKDNNIVVYFSLYEYTPYALGIPEFTIPVSSFKSP